jgi:hypothetical protein
MDRLIDYFTPSGFGWFGKRIFYNLYIPSGLTTN